MARNAFETASTVFASIMPVRAVSSEVPAGNQNPARRRVVILGSMDGGNAARNLAADCDMLVHVEPPCLEAAWLARFQPDLVIAPLIARSWDILDIAEKLVETGYRGPLMVHSAPLPRAELVIAEIKALFPDLSLIFVEMAD